MRKDEATHRDLHPWFDWRFHDHRHTSRIQEDCNGRAHRRRFNSDLVGRAISDYGYSGFLESESYDPEESDRFEHVGRWYRGLC